VKLRKLQLRESVYYKFGKIRKQNNNREWRIYNVFKQTLWEMN